MPLLTLEVPFCMHLSVMQCLFGANNLFFPYFAQIVPIFDGVGDNEPLVKIFVIDKKCEAGLMPGVQRFSARHSTAVAWLRAIFVCIKLWVLCYHNAKRTIFLTFCPSYGKIGGSENRRAYGR